MMIANLAIWGSPRIFLVPQFHVTESKEENQR